MLIVKPYNGCGYMHHNFKKRLPNDHRIGEWVLTQGYNVTVLQLVSVVYNYDVFISIRLYLVEYPGLSHLQSPARTQGFCSVSNLGISCSW